MPSADPNPIVSHLEDDEHHLTRAELEDAIAALRAELLAAIAEIPGAKAAGKPTKQEG